MMPKTKLTEALKNSSEITKKEVKELKEIVDGEEEEKEKELLKQQRDGMDIFFRKDSYVPAKPSEFEGHYPGNQNNTIVIPHSTKVIHAKSED